MNHEDTVLLSDVEPKDRDAELSYEPAKHRSSLNIIEIIPYLVMFLAIGLLVVYLFVR